MNTFYDSVYSEALRQTGNPELAKLAAAQASLETGYGKHVPGGNLFGIKGPGTGPISTTEVIGGQPVTVQDSFRAYGSPGDSIRGWNQFLRENPRYRKAGLFGAQTAPEMADALQRAGYATDPNYASKLKSIMGAQSGSQGVATGDVDVRLASADEELPPEMQVPGNPVTGMADLPQVASSRLPAIDPARLMAAIRGEQQQQANSPMANPWLQIGLGILANPAGAGASPWVGIARGVQQGMAAAAAATPKELSAWEMAKAELELEGIKQSREDRLAKQLAAEKQQAALNELASAYSDPTSPMYNPERALAMRAGLDVKIAEPTSSQRDYEYLTQLRKADGSPAFTSEQAAERAFGGGGVKVQIGEGGTQYGSIPAGYQRITDKGTGAVRDVPIPGSAEAEKRAAASRGITSALTSIDKIQDIVRTKGEGLDLAMDPQTRSRIGVLYQDLMASVAELNNAGVLQPGEIEMIKQGLPDPRDRFTLADRDAIIGAYEELKRRIGIRKGVSPQVTKQSPPGDPGDWELVP